METTQNLRTTLLDVYNTRRSTHPRQLAANDHMEFQAKAPTVWEMFRSSIGTGAFAPKRVASSLYIRTRDLLNMATPLDEYNDIPPLQRVIDDAFLRANMLDKRVNLYDGLYKNWMGCFIDSDQHAADIPLREVTLPGSHDSGSYQLELQRTLPLANRTFKIIGKAASIFGSVGHLVRDWTVTQGSDIHEQLRLGFRFFDLRVSYSTEENIFYLTHTYTCEPAEDVLKQFNRFLCENKNETVVIAIMPDSAHEGMTPNRGSLFIDQVKRELGDLMVQKNENSSYDASITMRKCAESGKRVIIYYKGSLLSQDPYIWNGDNVHANWDDTSDLTVKIEKLERRFGQMDTMPSDYNLLPWTLTPQTNDVLYSIPKHMIPRATRRINLRMMAHEINQILPAFFKKHKAGLQKISAITCDFPEPDFVKRVISLNLDKEEESYNEAFNAEQNSEVVIDLQSEID